MRAQPRKKQSKETAYIIYKSWKIKTVTHADFCRRWFRVVDMSNTRCDHYAPITSTQGEHFIFRYATFENFDGVRTDEARTLVKCQETSEIWVLCPNWGRSLACTNKEKQLVILIPQPVKTYRQILDFMKIFYMDGATFQRSLKEGTIKEIF